LLLKPLFDSGQFGLDQFNILILPFALQIYKCFSQIKIVRALWENEMGDKSESSLVAPQCVRLQVCMFSL
jgi:hypothetical protein